MTAIRTGMITIVMIFNIFCRVLTTSGKAFSKVTDFENMTSKGEDDIGGPFSVAALAQNPEKGMVFLITSNIFFNEEVDAENNSVFHLFPKIL